ncbi:hypothetical protein ABK040_008164 [Willaertia magna]
MAVKFEVFVVVVLFAYLSLALVFIFKLNKDDKIQDNIEGLDVIEKRISEQDPYNVIRYGSDTIMRNELKGLNKFSIVLINTMENHVNNRNLIGSIHKYHKTDITIYIYGYNLNQITRNEINLWKNVIYFDINELFIFTNNIERTFFESVNLFKPYIFTHAVRIAGKIVYIKDGYLLKEKLNTDMLDKYLEQNGSFYVTNKCNTDNHFSIVKDIDVVMFGMKFNSLVYNDIYLPLMECSKYPCSTANWKAANADQFEKVKKEAPFSCNLLENFVSSIVKESDLNVDNYCEIVSREDFIISPFQLSGKYNNLDNIIEGNSEVLSLSKTKLNDIIKQKEDKRIHIALGVPTISKGVTNIEQSPLVSVFIKSLRNSIPKKNEKDGDKYLFKLYLIIDRGDELYEKYDNLNELVDALNYYMKEHNFVVQVIRVINSHGWAPLLWNSAFQHAMDDGSDYFYQLNDDVSFKTEGWATKFTEILKNNPVKSNFGVTGPVDKNIKRKILTQAFVHKTHYKIFGYLFPFVFKNWHVDDWLSNVYTESKSKLLDESSVITNSNVLGTRYKVCEGDNALNSALEDGKKRIKDFLQVN